MTDLAALIFALIAALAIACGDDDIGTWERLAPMPTPRTDVAVAALNREIFVIGGLEADGSVSDKVEIYDTQTDTWREATTLFEPRHGAAAVTFDGRVWVIGGFARPGFDEPTDTVWAITSDGPAALKGRLNVARGGLAAMGGDSQPIAIGGASVETDVGAGSLQSVEFYDFSDDRWFEADVTLNVPRDHLAAVTVDRAFGDVIERYIYAMGGRCNLDEACNLNTAEACPLTGPCALVSPMPTARSGIAAVAFGPNFSQRIYVFGGEFPDGSFNVNEEYDTGSDTWRAMEPIPTARHGLGAAVVGDKIYVLGGSQQPGSVTGANEAFTPP